MDKLDEGLKTLLELGKRRGFLTFDQVNDFLPMSKRDIIARICAELCIPDPDLSIWPDKPDEGAAASEVTPKRPAVPDAALTAATMLRAPPAHANGHDPP